MRLSTHLDSTGMTGEYLLLRRDIAREHRCNDADAIRKLAQDSLLRSLLQPDLKQCIMGDRGFI